MKRRIWLLAAALSVVMSALMAFPLFAGTWTHTQKSQYYTHTYDNLWFFVKDNGQYAKEEWIKDADGTWYWITDGGYLPTLSGGIAKDGSLYDKDGKWVDMSAATGRHFIDQDMYGRISNGMSYEDAVGVLGPEHEIFSMNSTSFGSTTYNYVTYKWYTKDAKGSMYVQCRDGAVVNSWAYWH